MYSSEPNGGPPNPCRRIDGSLYQISVNFNSYLIFHIIKCESMIILWYIPPVLVTSAVFCPLALLAPLRGGNTAGGACSFMMRA